MASHTILRNSSMPWEKSRHPGVDLRRLFRGERALLNSVVLADYSLDTDVALHEVKDSEIIYVLSGCYEITLPEGEETEIIEEGDAISFPAGSSHGLRCVKPGRCLLMFSKNSR